MRCGVFVAVGVLFVVVELMTFVKPLNGPFDESPVTTTDGALTLRGLNIAAISPSLVMLSNVMMVVRHIVCYTAYFVRRGCGKKNNKYTYSLICEQ